MNIKIGQKIKVWERFTGQVVTGTVIKPPSIQVVCGHKYTVATVQIPNISEMDVSLEVIAGGQQVWSGCMV